MLILGVDPGLNGGLCWLSVQGTRMMAVSIMEAIEPMPVADKQINRGLLRALLNDFKPDVACVEKQSAMRPAGRRQGTTSMLNSGKHWGIVLMAATMTGARVVEVAPSKWKREMGLPRDKGASVQMASNLWPSQAKEFVGPRGGLRDGLAEAALIAEWYRRFG